MAYDGHYLIDMLLARIRCHVEISGSAADRGRARERLTALGWVWLNESRANPDRYVRVVRGTATRATAEEISQRLQVALADCHSAATIERVALERIRYASMRFAYESPTLQGLVYDERPVAVLADVSVVRSEAVAPAPLSPTGEETVLDRLRRAAARNVLDGFDKLCGKLETGALWIAGWSRRCVPAWAGRIGRTFVDKEAAGFLRYRLTLLLMVFVLSLAVTFVWRVRITRSSGLPQSDGLILIVLIGGIALLAAVLGTTNMFTRILVHRFDADLPCGYSRWQTSLWEAADPADAEMFIGRRRHRAIMVCWALGTLLCGTICAVLAGTVLAVLGSDLWYGRQDIVSLMITAGLLLLWVLAADMWRARPRSEVRRLVQRVGLSIVLTGLGGVILRMPSYLFYKKLGYPGLAFEIGWHDALVNASVFLVCLALSALPLGLCWLYSPRLPRFTRSGFAMVLTFAAAAMVLAGLGPSLRTAQIITVEQTTTAGGTRYPACITVNNVDQPIWIIGQTTRQLLIGDRTISDSNHTTISRIRVVPSNLPYRVVVAQDGC
ncbi:hypothetical protein [Nocardia niigatensis]|uniref:hypothetical protein n=1 Tax=Nocardia niigatensis TaxID=209249 RepID=UPI0002E40F11|nr:hypothetical protein [Nocardia niigatensis]